MSNAPIYVTQPYLPPLDEFLPYLEKIWANKVLTNNGPFHRELEEELGNYLGVKHLSLFTNATLALITALQALRITGEVIKSVMPVFCRCQTRRVISICQVLHHSSER